MKWRMKNTTISLLIAYVVTTSEVMRCTDRAETMAVFLASGFIALIVVLKIDDIIEKRGKR